MGLLSMYEASCPDPISRVITDSDHRITAELALSPKSSTPASLHLSPMHYRRRSMAMSPPTR